MESQVTLTMKKKVMNNKRKDAETNKGLMLMNQLAGIKEYRKDWKNTSFFGGACNIQITFLGGKTISLNIDGESFDKFLNESIDKALQNSLKNCCEIQESFVSIVKGYLSESEK